MHVKHYIYSSPWFLKGTPVYEEYELCKEDGEAISNHYTNPDPSLPIKHYYVVCNRILEGSEKTGE